MEGSHLHSKSWVEAEEVNGDYVPGNNEKAFLAREWWTACFLREKRDGLQRRNLPC